MTVSDFSRRSGTTKSASIPPPVDRRSSRSNSRAWSSNHRLAASERDGEVAAGVARLGGGSGREIGDAQAEVFGVGGKTLILDAPQARARTRVRGRTGRTGLARRPGRQRRRPGPAAGVLSPGRRRPLDDGSGHLPLGRAGGPAGGSVAGA